MHYDCIVLNTAVFVYVFHNTALYRNCGISKLYLPWSFIYVFYHCCFAGLVYLDVNA